MKKFIIAFASIIAFAALPVLAATGVWTAVGSSGSGGGGSCYLIKFNPGYYLIGRGVVSGSTFTGFLSATPNPTGSYYGVNYNTYGMYGVGAPYSKVAQCGSDVNCTYYKAYGIYHSAYNYDCFYSFSSFPSYAGGATICAPTMVQVNGFPITSAQPSACL